MTTHTDSQGNTFTTAGPKPATGTPATIVTGGQRTPATIAPGGIAVPDKK